jgi:hypothetical protein
LTYVGNGFFRNFQYIIINFVPTMNNGVDNNLFFYSALSILFLLLKHLGKGVK